MASPSAPASANSKKPVSRGPEPLQPPDERFWIRYSPHHELPVSMAGSFLLHALGVGLIALVLIGALTLFANPRPPEISPLMIVGGGGGNPLGVGDGSGIGVVPTGKEALPKEEKLVVSKPKVDAPDIKEVPKNPEIKLELPKEPVASRAIQESSVETELNRLSEVGKAARQQIEGIIAGHGKGGPGKGGGKGAGDGTGTGDLKGPGKGGRLDQRAKRQQRWTMMFSTLNGQDYLRQLQHLGAIVAVQQPDGSYVLYRDLSGRPPKGEPGDISTINRIYWVDDKPHSVQSLAQAMGIFPPPPYIAAFFPESLEDDLRRKERQQYSGREEDIEETQFRVIARGAGKYEAVIVTRPKLRGQ